MLYYSGIGSRETPLDFLRLFTSVASYLSDQGITLRTGGADGADSAFEIGASSAYVEIYLPWNGFNNNPSHLFSPTPAAFTLASQLHPAWHQLSQGAQKLMARNCHQVLGLDLQTPSSFIICWTPNGSGSGGTGQALRLAKQHNIPVFDGGHYNTASEARVALHKFLQEVIPS